MTGKRLVYVAGPLTTGNQDRNVNRAVKVADNIRAWGGVPIIPHLSTIWAMISDRHWSYEDWMEVDFAYIKRCDALYRMPGDSPGADREVRYAESLGIPVFCRGTEREFKEFLDSGRGD